MRNMRNSLVLVNLDKGLAYLGVSGVFENGEYADQSGYPQHRQRSGLPWSVWCVREWGICGPVWLSST